MSQDRYRRKLSEALTALHISSQSYDLGLTGEAPRLAATLRVLFHSNASSGNVSLLKHLRMEAMEMLSTVDPSSSQHLGFVAIRISLSSAMPVQAVPKLGNQFYPTTMSDWWSGQFVYQFNGRGYCRSHLVKTAANQDGGCHVDSFLASFYEDMEAGCQGLSLNGENLVYPKGLAPFDQSKTQHCQNIHYAMLRQFAHEVLHSASHHRWLDSTSSKSR